MCIVVALMHIVVVFRALHLQYAPGVGPRMEIP